MVATSIVGDCVGVDVIVGEAVVVGGVAVGEAVVVGVVVGVTVTVGVGVGLVTVESLCGLKIKYPPVAIAPAITTVPTVAARELPLYGQPPTEQ